MWRARWLVPLATGLLLLPAVARADEDTKEDKKAPAPQPAPAPAAADDAALTRKIEALEARLQELQDWKDDQELQALQQSAMTEAASEAEEKLEDRTYIQTVRALQAQNPEISIAGDFLFQLIADGDGSFYYAADDRSGLPLRAMDVHIQSSLDPFSLFKSAIGFEAEGGVGIEEIYVVWSGMVPSLTLTLGRFRHQFGVVNRWHEHDLEQTGYPLALTEMLGEDGLDGDGIGVTWHMGQLIAHANELTVQVTNGTNDHLFSGEHFSIPTVLAHFKNYYDLNEDTYLELGLTGMWGLNNKRGYTVEDHSDELFDEDFRHTWVAGADLTLFWEPLNKAKYYNFTWRTEYFFVHKEVLEEGSFTDNVFIDQGWGLYSYVQAKVDPSWFIGLRGDVVEPLQRERHGYQWQVTPYVTFWQSEFVYLRLEGQFGEGFEHGRDARILFQLDFAAGPHKHEKY